MTENIETRVALDAPFAPLNGFILAEQAAGRFAQMPPWDANKTMREAIHAIHKYRVGSMVIKNYYTDPEYPERLEELKALGIDRPEQFRRSLSQTYSNHTLKTIPVGYLLAVIAAAHNFPDREKPVIKTRSCLPLILADALTNDFDDLWQDLDLTSEQWNIPYPEGSFHYTHRIAAQVLGSIKSPNNISRWWPKLHHDFIQQYPDFFPSRQDYERQFPIGWYNSEDQNLWADEINDLIERDVQYVVRVMNRLGNIYYSQEDNLRQEDIALIKAIYRFLAYLDVREPLYAEIAEVPDPRDDYDHIFEDLEAIAVHEAIDELNDRDKRILELRFPDQGQDPVTFKELAQTLNVCIQRAADIERSSLRKLRKIATPILRKLTLQP